MLGRVRASPISSLELLEMERSSSKISKHDSLSIYESTLLKLKQGSQCCQRSTSEGSATTYTHSTIATHPPEEVMSNADCSSAESSPNPSGISRSAHSSNEKQSTNMSILCMFSNYKISKHAESSADTKYMDIESCYSSSSSGFSPTSNSS
ncbi:uncharacterized protein [Primulina eburnea]|uniref:uncharacterized protein n=1 Tax=Primulina eburnea TaxID=1245227 RepID=UPI003C6C4948